MPKAVKYILVPYSEYADLIEIKKKTHSISSVNDENLLTRSILPTLNSSELTDFEKITKVIKKLTEMLHNKLIKHEDKGDKLLKEQHDTTPDSSVMKESIQQDAIKSEKQQPETETVDTDVSVVPDTPPVEEVIPQRQKKTKPYPLKRLHLDVSSPEANTKTDEVLTKDNNNKIKRQEDPQLTSTRKRIRRNVQDIRKDWIYY